MSMSWISLLVGRKKSSARVASVHEIGGADRDRTGDLKLAKLALSQLSYGPSQGQLQLGLRGQD